MYIELPELAEQGYVVLDRCDLAIPPAEYLGLEYRDWKSGGDTNFAPIASAYGAIECAGFWDHGKPDKDGVWTSNAERCPTLVEWTERVGAGLRPGADHQARAQRHGRRRALPPPRRQQPPEPRGEGWVVRAWLQLTDDPDSFMILRRRKDDRASEVRIPLPQGAQFVVDSERWWHGVYHRPGAALRADRQLRERPGPGAVDRRQPGAVAARV